MEKLSRNVISDNEHKYYVFTFNTYKYIYIFYL